MRSNGNARTVEHTAGVDLSTDPQKTATCVIEWRHDRAKVIELELGVDDDTALRLIGSCEKTGIDAPFGWPREFRRAIHAYATQPTWPSAKSSRLSSRETDRRVHAAVKMTPLPVAASLIGATAMRCAGILSRAGIKDRSGMGRACEVYPAASLKRWGFAHNGYKLERGGDRAKKALRANVLAIRQALPGLDTTSAGGLLSASDDAFDALIASITAKAVLDGRATAPTDGEQTDLAQEEGWIWIPESDFLITLARGQALPTRQGRRHSGLKLAGGDNEQPQGSDRRARGERTAVRKFPAKTPKGPRRPRKGS